MGKNGVKVIIRTRPTASFASGQIQIDQDDNTITLYSNTNGVPSSPTKNDTGGGSPGREPTSNASTGPSNRKDSWRFKFHQVLHNASQDKVYEAIARDIVHGAVVDGVNGTILAYGQTGAGKSFTMIGDTRNYQHRGIAPRAIAQVYEEIENRIEIAYSIHVSYMEIYNDRIYDLLEPFNPNSAENERYHGDLVVVEDARGTYVRGLTQIDAANEQEALDQLFNGELQRTVAEHQLNKRSNRSHCIFTLHISQKSRAGGNERVTHSKLHLVDLAGSERLKKTMDDGNNSREAKSIGSSGGSTVSTIKKESMYINQSLSFLEQCIVALGAKGEPRQHIPYRQTKLTNVLKDSLGGNSNTLMFACIWGESKHLEETISTLKLAQRMMRVQNEVATIIETDPMILLRKYEKQIKDLKHELVMHDALMERTGIVGTDGHSGHQDELVGEDDPTTSGFGLGVASSAARPSTMDAHKRKIDGGGARNNAAEDGGRSRHRSPSPTRSPKHGGDDKGRGVMFEETGEERGEGDEDLDGESGRVHTHEARMKNEAFKFYKSTGHGKKIHRSLQEEKDKLFECKQKVKMISGRLNAMKVQIDEVKVKLEEKRSHRGGGGNGNRSPVGNKKLPSKDIKVATSGADEVVDEEEFILMRAEREAKREYRSLFDDLKEARSEMEFTNRSVELLRMRLVREFEDWYEEEGHQLAVAKDNEDDGYDGLTFGNVFSKEDKLDDGEKFDQMEVERIRAQDPDSLAFFQAQKKMRQQAGNSVAQSKAQRKSKRV
ncbi:hypothetical protein Poli38472_011660 [Pythium oligandrum]|uniref:Kinesin-like protein n=1 Tax=Pythium oligandrum TaxID=41045 RepID=A0A8K1CK80_PYTOL|nr:hypothetical protein Poli38472_011660 [Pythium oligandrum]|eukprot:TMW64780.1 hypothetical protein Poli38472_011660 [Pythium oligandrum]